MPTTWILIVTYFIGANAGYQYAITGLPSYEECVRISKQIPVPDDSFSPFITKDRHSFKCIEVKK